MDPGQGENRIDPYRFEISVILEREDGFFVRVSKYRRS